MLCILILNFHLSCFFRLLLFIHTHVTCLFSLEIKAETRGCLELNICGFIFDDSTAKYTKESIQKKYPKGPNVIGICLSNDT